MLTIDNESGGTWTCDFNPFNLSYICYSLGPVYEPLAFVNTLQSGKITPWLATSWAWGNGNKTPHVHHPQGGEVLQRRPADRPPTWSTRSTC